MPERILVVEDEQEIASYLRRGLSFEGYAVEVVDCAADAFTIARERPPDLVILDLGLPDLDGLEVARRLRAGSNFPIIILTARDTVSDRVAGLEGGADDYLTKPFAFEELVARIHVQLRRKVALTEGTILRYSVICMDIAAHEVTVHNKRVNLTAREFDILELRDVMYERIWGYNYGADSNVIEVYVRALRQKLEIDGAPRLIQTIRGVGYSLRHEP
jgi:DNA-binding response OmpR family regulator